MKWQSLALLGLFCACNGPVDETDDTDPVDTDTDTDTEDPGPLALIGDWAEVGGDFPDNAVWGYHTVLAGTWSDAFGASYAIVQYDNDAMHVIAQNGATNTYSPGLWSRFDFAPDGGDGFYYCQTAFNAPDEATALATPRSDDTDPAAGGCGGMFAWSHLQPTIPVTGAWDDGFSIHVVDEANWAMGDDVFHLKRYDAAESYAIANNDGDNAFNAGLWSRFDWQVDGSVFYCQTAYDAATQSAAAAQPNLDLDTGCGGFPWSTLAPVDL